MWFFIFTMFLLIVAMIAKEYRSGFPSGAEPRH